MHDIFNGFLMLGVKQMFNTSIRVQGERISMLRFADIVPFTESEVKLEK